MNLSAIRDELHRFDHHFSGGVADAVIQAASAAIGLPFPPGYVEFLRALGSGYVSFQEFIGLGGPAHLNVEEQTKHLRAASRVSRFPHQLIPVLADGYGNFDCIDTSRPTIGGECAIVNWLHDGGDEQEYEELAGTYLDWLWSALQMIRSVDAT